MEKLFGLLQRKNTCFRSFMNICSEFLDEIAAGNSENLEKFQVRRQGLLNVLEQLEVEITQRLDALKGAPETFEKLLTPEAKEKMTMLLKEKDSFLKQILDLDHQILMHINRLKDDTLQKLHSIQLGRKTVGAYRSPAEKVDQAEGAKLVDHEAE